MRLKEAFFSACIMVTFLMPAAGLPCTSFFLDHAGQKVFGKNYDWHLEPGLIIINKRGVLKTAIRNEEKHPPPYARWTSRYGSLTFNQYGREIPNGGINEAGLVIEVLMLVDTEYPEPDSCPAVTPMQWVQYQLDTASSVEEVVSSAARLRILPEGSGVHYLVADKQGNCVSIEFLDGKLVSHTGDSLPVKALTNNTYADSLRFLKEHKGFGGQLEVTKGEHSMTRFVQAAYLLKAFDEEPQTAAVDYAFKILSNVKQESHAWGTKWSIVYDMSRLRVYFRTFSKQSLRYIDLQSFDFSCLEPVRIMDINRDGSGDVSGNFQNYTQQINLDLIRNSFKNTLFLSRTPEAVMEDFSKYPDTTSCSEQKK